MKELLNTLDQVILQGPNEFFIEGVIKWASFVLKCNTGKALDHGLEIAKQMRLYADSCK